MSMLSQNAAEPITSMDVERRDPGWGSVRGGKRSERSCLMESPMWPVFVIEGFELAQRVQKVVLVPDQHPVQQLAPAGLDPSLHDRIHARYPGSALKDAESSIDQHGIEGRGELGVSVPYQEPGGAAGLLKVHNEVATWVTHCPVGCAVTPRIRTRRVACSMTARTYMPLDLHGWNFGRRSHTAELFSD
nr:hypothetical protein [Nonomuraea solani]